VDAWQAVQAFYDALPELDPVVESKTFHLATQCYGGHWGPGFFNYFRKQNALLSGDAEGPGVKLDMGALMIINGITDARSQYPSYPTFALNNTHGVEVNDTVATYMEFSLNMQDNGCLALIGLCEDLWALSNGTALVGDMVCNEANAVCRRTVELPYYTYATPGDTYDMRNATVFPPPPGLFSEYLNQAEVQQALGVTTNYTGSVNSEVTAAFWSTGDHANPKLLPELEELLEAGVRVALWYGDSDYICNWYGGEALSLGVNYTGAGRFREAGYTPLLVDGTAYGDARESANFSFTRVFDAGHAMPYYQPEAALAMFERTINGWDTATGERRITADYATVGDTESRYNQKEERANENSKGGLKSAKFRF